VAGDLLTRLMEDGRAGGAAALVVLADRTGALRNLGRRYPGIEIQAGCRCRDRQRFMYQSGDARTALGFTARRPPQWALRSAPQAWSSTSGMPPDLVVLEAEGAADEDWATLDPSASVSRNSFFSSAGWRRISTTSGLDRAQEAVAAAY
jgi:hypothetical protein